MLLIPPLEESDMAEEQVQEVRAGDVPAKKKGVPKIIVIGVLALAVAGGAGYFFFGKTLIGANKSTEIQSHEKKKEVGPIIALEPFIINVSGSASRFVKISVAVELGSEKAVEHTKKLTPVIRDMMLTVLGSKAPEVFMDVNGRATMKKELFDGLSSLFKGSDLKGVYITDIIMQ
jgi:flagellar protein FliL